MAQEEQVLVVERNILERAGMFQGLTFDAERYLRVRKQTPLTSNLFPM